MRDKDVNWTMVMISLVTTVILVVSGLVIAITYMAARGEVWAVALLGIIVGTALFFGGAVTFGKMQLKSMENLFKMNTAENLAMMTQQAKIQAVQTGQLSQLASANKRLVDSAPQSEIRPTVISYDNSVFDGVD